jgi:two-component system cell cycle response regulator
VVSFTTRVVWFTTRGARAQPNCGGFSDGSLVAPAARWEARNAMAALPFERTLIVEPAADWKAAARRQGTLTVLTGNSMGTMRVLTGDKSLLGRGDSVDLCVSDAGISRVHAAVHRVADGYEIEDLGSSNGTFLEHGRLSGRAPLRDGARIWLGNTLMRFALQDDVEQAASQRMYDLSVRDGLTGLYNRRHLDERVTSELAFAQRHATPLALLLVDIDHFKQINDRFGHQAGDAVLQRVAEVLAQSVRTEDVVARYGGEEFAVIGRGIDPVGAQAFGERLRTLVASMRLVYEGQSISVTVSIGVAHNHRGAPISKAAALLSAADQALYAAKRGGRNRVCMAASPGSYSSTSASRESAAPERKRTWEIETAPASLNAREGTHTMRTGSGK